MINRKPGEREEEQRQEEKRTSGDQARILWWRKTKQRKTQKAVVKRKCADGNVRSNALGQVREQSDREKKPC